MSDHPPSGDISAGRDIHAQNVITGIQHNFTLIFQQPVAPPPDLAHLRADYLAYLRDSYRYLDMKGLMQVQQVTQQLSLAAVYVPLKATSAHAGPGDLLGRVAGRWLSQAGELEVLPEAALTRTPTPPQLIEQALHDDPAVVVLGDPGAGKSTLLKVLALALAEQMDGPLPILLPLNAYARHLEQHAASLSDYLAEYYSSRQRKLARIGDLFNHALSHHQAVVLLDGLDEVQANRQHLVRRVQDFVSEHVPAPAGTADRGPQTRDGQAPSPDPRPPTPSLPGNRIVVTSRIVGYEEAPLAGRQWRVYSLTDFSREDIEQFVTQWTLAFAASIQGDTEPARQSAAREQRELLAAIFSRPSVERLAANPLLLTILALIKYTGTNLPEQRVKLYELYLQALIESWNLARSLDQYPVGPGLSYEETVQVLAPLALWLRQENPTAGLVSLAQLENWLAAYYHGPEWGLPPGEARRRGRELLDGVQRYANLLLERGERQYGFLHLTLEEMLAAKGLAQLYFDDPAAALALIAQTLTDPRWHETLQLAVGVVGIVQQLPRQAGALLQQVAALTPPAAEPGYAVTFAGQVLLDVGAAGVGQMAAQKITAALAETMQGTACPIRLRRDAGDALGRLGWTPEPEPDALLLAPAGYEPSGLDAFRFVPEAGIWLGKYPVTNRQFARFIAAGGYDDPTVWSADGWAWRSGTYDSKAPESYQNWLNQRPLEKRHQPHFWDERHWNSPLYPVVGVTWFEAEAYCRWLSHQATFSDQQLEMLAQFTLAEFKSKIVNRKSKIEFRLPTETEWAAAIGGRGAYPWGEIFDPAYLNCAESWFGRNFKDDQEWLSWITSAADARREAGLTAVTTYPQGLSQTGVWDGSGNVWEWMGNPYQKGGDTIAVRGGSWNYHERYARVSYRVNNLPDIFFNLYGFRVSVAPVLS